MARLSLHLGGLAALVLWLYACPANAYLDLSAASVETLENGLTVIVLEEHGLPVVSVQMLYKSGARNEVTGATGLAHFMEHMAFRASENFPDTELVSSIYAVGGEWHGYTWLDQTTYFETTPAKHLDLLLRIEADRMARLKIPEADVDSERGAVLTEMHGYENDPTSVLHDNVLYVSFLAHAYRNNTIGWEDDIANITHAQLVAFYSRHYQPANAVLAIVGDISVDDAMRQGRHHFAGIEGRAAVPVPHTAEPQQTGERRISLQGALDQKYFKIAYRAPSVGSPDYAAFLLAQELLAASSGVSFLQNDWGTPARPGSALAGISDDLVTWFPPSAQNYVFTIGGSVPVDRNESAIESAIDGRIQGLLAQFGEGGKDSVALLEKARQQVLRELVFDVQTTEDAAHQLAFFAGLDALDVLQELPKALHLVGVKDIHRVLGSYLGAEKRTIGWYAPTAEKKPVVRQPAHPVLPESGSQLRNEPTAPVLKHAAAPARLQRLSNGTPVILRPSTLSPTVVLKVIVPSAGFTLPADVSQSEPAQGLSSIDFERLSSEVGPTITQARALLDTATPLDQGQAGSATGPEALLERAFNDILKLPRTAVKPTGPLLLVLSGAIDPAVELKRLESSFGGLPGAVWSRPPLLDPPPAVDIEKNTVFPVAQEQLGYVVRVPNRSDDAAIAWQLVLYVLNHGYEGRLGKEAISRRGLVYYIDTAYHTDGQNDWITMSTGVDADKLPAMKKLFRAELDRLLASPPSVAELEEAKNHLLGRFDSAAQSNLDLADSLTRQWVLHDGLLGRDELVRKLEGVTRQDIINLLPAFTNGSFVSIRNP